MRRVGWALSALFFIPLGVCAQDLFEVLQSALTVSPDMAAQEARLHQIEEKTPEANAAWKPSLVIGAKGGPHHAIEIYDISFFDAAATAQEREYYVTLTQPLYRGGGTIASLRDARAAVAAERARTASIQAGLLVSAAKSYFDVFRDTRMLAYRVENESTLHRQMDLAEERFAGGQVTRTDILQSESRFYRSTADRLRAAADLEHSESDFRRYAGYPAEALVDASAVTEHLSERLHDPHCDIASNPDIVAANYDADQAHAQIEEARAKGKPTIDLALTASSDTGNSISSPALISARTIRDYSAFLKLTIPIYTGGLVAAQVREADYAEKSARHKLDGIRDKLTADYRSYWATLAQGRQQQVMYRLEIAGLEKALEGVRREQEVGGRTVLDILNADQELVDGRISLLLADHDVALAIVQAAATAGCLARLLNDLSER